MKCQKDLFKKMKIKTMNNKMSKIHIYPQLNLKKQTRRTDRIMDTENVLMVARWEGGVGEWVKR